MKDFKRDEKVHHLVASIQSGINPKANMELLYYRFKDCISYYACKISRENLHNQQDLIQEGYLALDAAVRKYDVDQGGGFIAYAQRRIYGAMLDEFYKSRFSMSVSAKMGYQVHRYNSYVINFHHEHRRIPTDEEIMSALQIVPKSLKTIRQANNRELRLDTFIDDAEDSVIAESISSGFNLEEFVLEEMDSQKCRKYVSACIARLEENKRAVIHGIYWDEQSFRKLAITLGCDAGKIQRLKEQALLELREMDEIQALYEVFDYSSEGLTGTGFRAWKETWESSVERAVRKKLAQEKRIENHFKKVVGVSVSEALPYFGQLDERKQKLLICRYVEYQAVKNILLKISVSDTRYWELHKEALQDLKEILAA